MKLLSNTTCLLMFAAVCASASSIDITFTQPVLSVLPGEATVVVVADLQNTDPADTVFLNSAVLTVPQAAAVNDEFFMNVPISLAPAASTGPIELFQFDVAANALPGAFVGTYQLLGGVGSANQNNFDLVGSQTFSVSVADVPEAATEFLLAIGLIAIACVRRVSARVS